MKKTKKVISSFIKRLINRMVEIVNEINPDYPFAKVISTIVKVLYTNILKNTYQLLLIATNKYPHQLLWI
jgi:hypothetical protein